MYSNLENGRKIVFTSIRVRHYSTTILTLLIHYNIIQQIYYHKNMDVSKKGIFPF